MDSDLSLRPVYQQTKAAGSETWLSIGILWGVLARRIELIMNSGGIITDPNSLLYSVKDLKVFYNKSLYPVVPPNFLDLSGAKGCQVASTLHNYYKIVWETKSP